MVQTSIHEEIECAPSVTEVMSATPMYLGVVVHYVRPRQVTYVRETLQIIIKDLVQMDELDLETDPLVVRV
jgi:Ras GTPase-activating-like protein IQGAP2/3